MFSGIGGFDYALNRLGGKCVMASEIDKYARQAYEVTYGETPAGDITQIDANDVPDHDILTAGFPCQSFSVAGKRGGFDDARGTLFFEVARIASTKQPNVLLLENVKGLVGHDGGKTLNTIVTALNECGYAVDFDVLNSKYFGVPQNRERIFIVALREDIADIQPWNIPKQRKDVVAKGKRRIAELDGVKTFNFEFPTNDTVDTRLRDILESGVDERYYLSEEKTAKLVAQLEDKHRERLDDVDAMITDDGPSHSFNVKGKVTPPVRAQGGGRQPGMWIIQEAQSGTRLRNESGTLRTGGTDHQHIIEPSPEMVGLLDMKGNESIRRVDAPMGISPTVSTCQGGHREPKIAVEYSRKDGIGKERDTALCLSASDWRGLNRNQAQNAVFETHPNYRIRKLTPRECFRLQGFPDDVFEKAKYYYSTKDIVGFITQPKKSGFKGEKLERISNSQLYKMAGNAVSVPVVEALGWRLLPYLDAKDERSDAV